MKMQDTVRSVLLGQEGLFESSKGSLEGKQRVDLLKAIEGDSFGSSLSRIHNCNFLLTFCSTDRCSSVLLTWV